MDYAVHYGPKGESAVYSWENNGLPNYFTLFDKKAEEEEAQAKKTGWSSTKRKKVKPSQKRMEKSEFIAGLGPTDTIWTHLGGANDKFCLAALTKGIRMFRVPSYLITEEINQQKEAGKEELEEPWEVLLRFARDFPGRFYELREPDIRILEVKMLARAYRTARERIIQATEGRLRSLKQDLYLLTDERYLQLAQKLAMHYQNAFNLRELQRLDISIEREMRKTLQDHPLWQMLFEPIRGTRNGGVIAGFVLGTIADIRRFSGLEQLRAYAGFHLVKEKDKKGKETGRWVPPRRKIGEQANWNPTLKQGVWLFSEEMNKQSLGHPWKDILEQRAIKEREKAPELPQWRIRKRALRWLGQQFLHYIWHGWRVYEGIAEEEDKPIYISV